MKASPEVEIIGIEGCPNLERTQSLVQRVAAELNIQPTIRRVIVADARAAARLGFLGSPTVLVNGVDVEPGAGERTGDVLSCRIYRDGERVSGQPDETHVREALVNAAA